MFKKILIKKKNKNIRILFYYQFIHCVLKHTPHE